MAKTEEEKFIPGPALLKRWEEERAEEEAVSNREDPMNPRNWGKLIVDSYLDSWYNLHPGVFHLYYREHNKVGVEMVSAFRYEHPGIFEQIWEDLAEKEFAAWNPPRPQRR